MKSKRLNHDTKVSTGDEHKEINEHINLFGEDEGQGGDK